MPTNQYRTEYSLENFPQDVRNIHPVTIGLDMYVKRQTGTQDRDILQGSVDRIRKRGRPRETEYQYHRVDREEHGTGWTDN